MQLSIDIDDKTARQLEQKARQQELSLEALIRKLLQQMSVEGPPQSKARAYHDLDELASTWSKEETAAFMNSIADFEKIEEDIWK